MKCEIISVGSELTSGQNLDTNSQWLSLRLAEIGIAVGWHTTIADDLDANIDAFRIASRRAKLILVTGGLGPTQDDLTREALARAAGVELVFDPESLAHIEEMFTRRDRTMPDRNRVQAYFPEVAEPIRNDHGTAPGVWMALGDAHVAAMPGVPSEMFAMFREQVLPRVTRLGLRAGVLIQRKINTFGAGESAVEEKLFDITRRGHVPEVGITASDAVISLRIFGRGASEAEALAQIAPIEATIRERLGDLVFGAEADDLHDAVAALLRGKGLTLSVAESITAGLVCDRLASVPGASAWLAGGITAYTNRVKVTQLGVPPGMLDTHGAVSAEVAESMAIGVRARFGTDLGLSTTGLAGPDSDESGKPVGLVYVGLAWEGGTATATVSWMGTRQEIRSRTARLALNKLRLHLLGAG